MWESAQVAGWVRMTGRDSLCANCTLDEKNTNESNCRGSEAIVTTPVTRYTRYIHGGLLVLDWRTSA